jgi:hypothetical protein
MGSDVSVWQQMDDAGCKLKVTVTLTCVERVGLCRSHKPQNYGCCPIVNGQMVGLFFFCAVPVISSVCNSRRPHIT